jgi:hypothetical protein
LCGVSLEASKLASTANAVGAGDNGTGGYNDA